MQDSHFKASFQKHRGLAFASACSPIDSFVSGECKSNDRSVAEVNICTKNNVYSYRYCIFYFLKFFHLYSLICYNRYKK